MGRVERFTSTAQVPVEQAQLIDPASFRFSRASAEALKAIGGVLTELEERKKEMQDRIGISNVNAAMEDAEREYQKEIIGKSLEERAAIRIKHINNAKATSSQQRLTKDTRVLAENKLRIWNDEFNDREELIALKALEKDAIIRLSDDYGKALTEGTKEDIIETRVALVAQLKGSMTPAEAKKFKEKIEADAAVQIVKNAVNAVHEAIETATDPETGTGNFTLAKELAKNPLIAEKQQATLRTAINTAEKARNTKIDREHQELIDTTTSDTIREYFAKDLTVVSLNQRHEDGLIKDSEFKFMMQGLQDPTPKNTDPFAAGRIRKAYADFEADVINREEADNVVLENYLLLDGADRSKVVADLEDVATKIIGTAKSTAYSEGRGLISRQFSRIQTFEDLITQFAGVGDEQLKEINRRWTAEINNRDLYERAIDDRFREMRKAGISEGAKFKAESLEILLQYQRRKQLSLEELEAAVGREQQRIQPLVGPPAPILRPVSEFTAAEARAELARRRARK